MKIFISSIIIKASLVLIPLTLLKMLSENATSDTLSNFFITYNISIYLFAFLFSLPAISLLRFYHHKPFYLLQKFGLNIFISSISIFLIVIALVIILEILFNYTFQVNLFSILILSSGMGYFLLVSNIYRANERLSILAFVHIYFFVTFSLGNFYFLSSKYSSNYLILLLGINYWIVSIILRFLILKKHKFNLSNINFLPKKYILKDRFFRYAFPLAIVGLLNSTMATSNQIILKFFVSSYELSGYIASYLIAEKIFFAVQSLIVFIFLPLIYKRFNNINYEAIKYIRNLSLLYLVIGILICLLSILLGDRLIILLSSENFIEFSWLIPIIGIGLIFLGVAASILVEIYLVSKNSYIVMKIYFYGALINVVSNILLIPFFGVIGAMLGPSYLTRWFCYRYS